MDSKPRYIYTEIFVFHRDGRIRTAEQRCLAVEGKNCLPFLSSVVEYLTSKETTNN